MSLLLLLLVSFPFACFALEPPAVPVLGNVQSAAPPPLLDSPVYSMATLCDSGKDKIEDENDTNDARPKTTNMNVVTYATPVSVAPDRIWALGLYKETLSYADFCLRRSCILQLLSKEHTPLIRILGGTSGRDVEKQEECQRLGFAWHRLPPGSTEEDGDYPPMPLVLPGCVKYLRLKAVGDLRDMGSHAVALCRVEETWGVPQDDPSEGEEPREQPHLSTARLRELGIITAQGRVADQSAQVKRDD